MHALIEVNRLKDNGRMLWVLDVGNTKIASSFYDMDAPVPQCMAEFQSPTHQGIEGVLQGYFQLLAMTKPPLKGVKRVCVASVVKGALEGLDAALIEAFQEQDLTPPQTVYDMSHLWQTMPISPEIPFPHKIGQDRLLNALAVHAQGFGAAIIADIGTATTIDYVDENGMFHGGMITVGAGMMARSLHKETNQLPEIILSKKPSGVLGRNTEEALQMGVFWGMRGILSGIVQQIRDAFGCDVPLVLTGGGAWIVQDMLQPQDRYWRTLTRDGLFYYDKMTQKGV